jgi:hypothetical protein
MAGTANIASALDRSRSTSAELSARARAVAEEWRHDPVASRAFRHGVWLVAGFSLLFPAGEVVSGSIGFDAHAYYAAWTHHSLYSRPPESIGAYLYSPAFAQAIRPLTLLPWPAFCALWLTAVAVTYLWLLAPLPMRWRIPLLVIVLSFDTAGNVWAFFALVLVFGFRRPALWAFPVLTKVTPFLGPVWFAARREWRNLVITVGATLAIMAASAAASPHLWVEWFRFLLTTHPAKGIAAPSTMLPTPILLAVELPIALALTAFAARRNCPWLLPIAMFLAEPVLAGQALFVLTAMPRLWPAAPVRARAFPPPSLQCAGLGG